MYTRLRNFLNYTHGTYGVVASLFEKTFRTVIDTVIPISIADKKEEIKRIVGWKNKTSNTNFNKLIDIFSKDCPPKNEFLTRNNPTNLGSNRYAYNQFRLNWIILLAFHTLYIKKIEPETVGELIKALYDAFLGWMTMTGHKDTTMRMFRNTLVSQTPSDAYSDEVKKQMKIAVGDPTLQPLVKNIQDKLCELEKNKNPVIEVLHGDEYDDEMNDPDFVPPEGGDSDSSDGGTSAAEEEVAAELRLLSPAEEGLGKRRSQRQGFRWGPRTPDESRQSGLPVPPGDPKPDRVVESSDDESEFEGNDKPPVSVLSERDIDLQRRRLLGQLKQMDVKVGNIPPQAIPDSQRPGAVGNFNINANQEVEKTPGRLPRAVPNPQRIDQQRTSQPIVINPLPRKQLSFSLPVAPASTSAAPAPTPAPPSEPLREGTLLRRTPLTNRVAKTKTGTGGERGGNNKKRTRKHKKHTSISASRRPTRRRRNPPTEGHKYTRKRPRT
jgi:hypothetical protein